MSRSRKAGCSPEVGFVLQQVAAVFGSELPGAAETPAEALDWAWIVDFAGSHGLGPLVNAGLTGRDAAVPEDARRALHTQYLESAVRNDVWLDPSLRRILDSFTSAGIEPVVLKGAALAYQAYPRPALRTMSDLDLLLAPPDLPAASKILLELGYRTDAADPAATHHLPGYYSPDGRVRVELHRDLLESPHPYVVDSEGLRARAHRARIAGREALALAISDALHHVCVHLAYTHRYEWHVLRSLTDILALTTTCRDGLDWEAFLQATRQGHTAGAVYWALAMSRFWLGAPIPDAVLIDLSPSPPMRDLLRSVFEREEVLLGNVEDGSPRNTVNQILLTQSLYGGCSSGWRTRAFLESIFPPPKAVGHLPISLTRSRIRYAAYLGNPVRLVRGLLAFGRMVTEL